MADADPPPGPADERDRRPDWVRRTFFGLLVLSVAADVTGLMESVTGRTLSDVFGSGPQGTESAADIDTPSAEPPPSTTTTETTTTETTTTTTEPSTTTTSPPTTTLPPRWVEPENDDVRLDVDDTRAVHLFQAEPAGGGEHWYHITVSGFPPNVDVEFSCHDDGNPDGFYFGTLTTAESGWGWAMETCASGPGDHWVIADGLPSARIPW